MKPRLSQTDQCGDCVLGCHYDCTGKMRRQPDEDCLCECRKPKPEPTKLFDTYERGHTLKEGIIFKIVEQKRTSAIIPEIHPHSQGDYQVYYGSAGHPFKMGASYRVVKAGARAGITKVEEVLPEEVKKPEVIPSTWLKVNKCYLTDKVGDVLTIQKICDNTTIWVRPATHTSLDHYFNCNRGAKVTDFKVGSSYKIVKEEVQIMSSGQPSSQFKDIWLEEVQPEANARDRTCETCKGVYSEKIARDQFKVKEPSRFCCKICEAKKVEDLPLIEVVCVAPWMGIKKGDEVKVSSEGCFNSTGGRWLNRLTDNQPTNVYPHASFREGDLYEVIADGGGGTKLTLKLKASTPQKEHSVAFSTTSVKVSQSEPILAPSQEDKMNGTIYKGVVVRNKVVPQGEGVSTGATISEVLFESPKAFIAANEQMARAKVLVDAKLALKEKLDLEDVLQPVEVKLSVIQG